MGILTREQMRAILKELFQVLHHPSGKFILDWFYDFTGVGEQFKFIHPGPYPLGALGILP
jgi:hypothetical protein